VNVDGSTVFSQAQLSRYFESYLATEIDRGKLVQMADAITARYRQAGYLLSYAMVPSQNVEAGMTGEMMGRDDHAPKRARGVQHRNCNRQTRAADVGRCAKGRVAAIRVASSQRRIGCGIGSDRSLAFG